MGLGSKPRQPQKPTLSCLAELLPAGLGPEHGLLAMPLPSPLRESGPKSKAKPWFRQSTDYSPGALADWALHPALQRQETSPRPDSKQTPGAESPWGQPNTPKARALWARARAHVEAFWRSSSGPSCFPADLIHLWGPRTKGKGAKGFLGVKTMGTEWVREEVGSVTGLF